ncbi:MAG: hypothetical protein CSA83_01350 [Actinomycetales bacterium]|nr:MAG: hypothetical protein CSA83_01350 [Actinomycetales bacterium]
MKHRGLAGSVQVVLLLPAFFMVMLLSLQWALHSWGTATAAAAAQSGAREATNYLADPDIGIIAAKELINPSALQNAEVTLSKTADSVTVTVTGSPMSLMPGWESTISKSVTASTERITSIDE